MTGTSPSDCLVLYPRHTLKEFYPSAEMQSVYFTAPDNWAVLICNDVILNMYLAEIKMQDVRSKCSKAKTELCVTGKIWSALTKRISLGKSNLSGQIKVRKRNKTRKTFKAIRNFVYRAVFGQTIVFYG